MHINSLPIPGKATLEQIYLFQACFWRNSIYIATHWKNLFHSKISLERQASSQPNALLIDDHNTRDANYEFDVEDELTAERTAHQ